MLYTDTKQLVKLLFWVYWYSQFCKADRNMTVFKLKHFQYTL